MKLKKLRAGIIVVKVGLSVTPCKPMRLQDCDHLSNKILKEKQVEEMKIPYMCKQQVHIVIIPHAEKA